MKIKVISINHCFVPSGLYRYFSFNYYCNHNNEILIIARNKWDKRIKPSQSINKKEFIMSKHKIYRDRTLLQFCSVTQLCLTLCDPMNRNTPGLPVHHQLPEFTQIYDHLVGDAIQPSHPLSSHSPPSLNPSQHQSLFQ